MPGSGCRVAVYDPLEPPDPSTISARYTAVAREGPAIPSGRPAPEGTSTGGHRIGVSRGGDARIEAGREAATAPGRQRALRIFEG